MAYISVSEQGNTRLGIIEYKVWLNNKYTVAVFLFICQC